MRRMSFAFGQAPRIGTANSSAASPAPPAPLLRVRRRLADAVDEAFGLALAGGDIAAAEGLLDVLEGMRERERIKTPGDPLLDRARRELEAKKAARYRRY